MAPKPNSNKWTDIQLAIAAISITSAVAFWNFFAGVDKVKSDQKTAEQQALLIPTVTATIEVQPPTPVPTMPPTGYKILYGGTAPQPQVVLIQKPKGGGGGGNSGGGNSSAPSSNPVTSTSSS